MSQQKAYERAALEYERQIFLHQGQDSIVHIALLNKSESLKRLGQFGDALSTLERINLFALKEELKPKFYLNKALLQILTEDYPEAIFSLMVLKTVDTLNLTADILLCIAQNYALSWSKAKSQFEHIRATYNINGKISDSISDLYSHIPELKSEQTASYLSLIPGMGMVYADRWGEGALSFLLNVIPLSLGTYAVLQEYYITGILGTAVFVEKFNTGGRLRAEFLTRKYNHDTALEYNAKLKRLLLNLMP